MLRFTLACLLSAATLSAQDTSLHEYLIDGEPWREVASGYSFTDGLCVDADGHLYFTDVKAGEGIYKLDADSGKVSLHLGNLPGISGLQIGPDGRFYACQNREQRVIAISRQGEAEVLATGVKCNDLVVSKKGHVYFTETPTQSIHWITPDKQHRVADQGRVVKPNGITISADEATLFVSEHGGKHVWAWQIGADGSLSGGAPFMTLWLPVGKEASAGDGATTEAAGRVFVTTELGVQIFDPAGRLAGIIAKPVADGKVVSVEFAGREHNRLFVAGGGSVYARKLKVSGYFR
jgi:gluconolactonase